MQIYKAGVAEYNVNKMTTVGHAQLCQPVSNVSAFSFVRFFLQCWDATQLSGDLQL